MGAGSSHAAVLAGGHAADAAAVADAEEEEVAVGVPHSSPALDKTAAAAGSAEFGMGRSVHMPLRGAGGGDWRASVVWGACSTRG